MKKILLLFTLSIIITASAFEQEVSCGVRVDLNTSTFVGSDADGSNAKVGYASGLFVDYPMNNSISFVPELKYSNIGAKGDVKGHTTTFNMNYITLPLMFRFHFNPIVSLEVGPQLAYLATAKADIQNVSVDLTEQFQRFEAGIGVGSVFESNRVFLNGRYNYGLTQIIENQNGYNSVLTLVI